MVSKVFCSTSSIFTSCVWKFWERVSSLFSLFVNWYILQISLGSLDAEHLLIKNSIFWKKNGKICEKVENSKIYFQHFLGPMILHIWSKFHVPSLIFEGEDLKVILRKTRLCEKWTFWSFLAQIFKIAIFLLMKLTSCRTW